MTINSPYLYAQATSPPSEQATKTQVEPLTAATSALSRNAAKIYEDLGKSIYQIRVISKNSGEKYSIGSGFLISPTLMISNYHVISQAALEPDDYIIQYLHENGETGTLEIQNFNLVNDLALLSLSEEKENFLTISKKSARKGDRIYSIGNPHDLGMTIVEGIYNGLSKNLYHTRIIFSGALNPGMSGGPAFNKDGEIIGVNVAIKGDDIGYLISASHIAPLVSQPKTDKDEKRDWNDIIEKQVFSSQKQVFDQLLTKDWKQKTLGTLKFPTDISKRIKCWGDGANEDDDRDVSYSSISCSSEEGIYVSENQKSGFFGFNIFALNTKSLTNSAFHDYYSDVYENTQLYDNKQESDVTNFNCHADFVSIKEQKWKINFCTRQYQNMSMLHDTHIMMALLEQNKKGYIIEMAIDATSKESALKLYKKFLEGIDAK